VGDPLDAGHRRGERPESGMPLPNAADDAWAELVALREEAAALGLGNFTGDPLAVLRARVEQARKA
jgi:hypothetical protein